MTIWEILRDFGLGALVPGMIAAGLYIFVLRPIRRKNKKWEREHGLRD